MNSLEVATGFNPQANCFKMACPRYCNLPHGGPEILEFTEPGRHVCFKDLENTNDLDAARSWEVKQRDEILGADRIIYPLLHKYIFLQMSEWNLPMKWGLAQSCLCKSVRYT